jgi:cell division protein FtsN
MAKDYKNTPKPKDKKTKSTPGWVWMLTGLILGLFVAFLVYLKDNSPQHVATGGGSRTPAPVVEKGRPAESGASKEKQVADAGEDKKAKKPRFDFYNLLPEMEVFIPDKEMAKEREKANGDDDNSVYYLQVASFQHFKDADKLRAQLALINMESQIQRVTVDGSSNDKQTWYRVRLGPYKSAREADKFRNRLREQSLNPVILKVKN